MYDDSKYLNTFPYEESITESTFDSRMISLPTCDTHLSITNSFIKAYIYFRIQYSVIIYFLITGKEQVIDNYPYSKTYNMTIIPLNASGRPSRTTLIGVHNWIFTSTRMLLRSTALTILIVLALEV